MTEHGLLESKSLLNARNSVAWVDKLGELINSASRDNPLTFLGIGNPIRGDDSVGLYIASNLLENSGPRPRDFVKIMRNSISSESAMAKIRQGTAIIFDAVEFNAPEGSTVLAPITETKYGFFGTHNIPLQLIPPNSGRNVMILGVQGSCSEIGVECLSPKIKESADLVVETILELLARKK